MQTILLFYGQNGAAAKAKAAELRSPERRARPLHAEVCLSPQPGVVQFMPDVPDLERKRLSELFGLPPDLVLPPLPPPPVLDPLADLAPDWRSRDDLKQLAASVSGGRAVENKRQAIEVIEAALKARR
jgi:hypothetical protein